MPLLRTPVYLQVVPVFCLLAGLFFSKCKNPAQPATYRDEYNEPHRPQFHFSPQQKWMNDPNGMVFYQGEWHLFYQYYPDSTVWGPMHWGHAVSSDLLHWEHLPIALYPDSLGYIFSGSVVIDENNTTGFKTGIEKPFVAIYTYHDMAKEKRGELNRQYQALAYSNDRGRTWTKYAGNPVLPSPGTPDFRDPKVFWHQQQQAWIMTLAVKDHLEFYRSPNLKTWEKTGEFGINAGSHGGVWECPDLFQMPVNGSAETKWILLVSIGDGAVNGGSGTQYFVGNFDGKTFVNDHTDSVIHWLDYGRDNYAGVTWFGAPNNQRIFLGWMSNWRYAQVVPTQVWRSAMTLPRTLNLQKINNDYLLVVNPVDMSELYAGKPVNVEAATLSVDSLFSETTVLNEITVDFDENKSTANEFGIKLSNSKGEAVFIGFEKKSKQFFIDRTIAGISNFEPGFAGRHFAPRIAANPNIRFKIFTDRSSIEMFADDGQVVMTDLYFPNEDFTRISGFAKGGTAAMLKASVQPLNGIWGNASSQKK